MELADASVTSSPRKIIRSERSREKNIIAPFAAASLFNHIGNDAHIGLLPDFFLLCTKQVNAQRRIEACCSKHAETLDYAEILGKDDFHTHRPTSIMVNATAAQTRPPPCTKES